MMACVHLFILSFGLLGQAAALPQGEAPTALTANEKALLEKETRIESRIKTYAGASDRIHHAFHAAIRGQQFDTIPGKLRDWLELLRFSLNDVRASLEKKKKSRALKNFEIQLRRASLDVQSYKIKAPIEQQDQIDDWLSQAESIRTQFMGMLFPQ